jgi:hypothetical protein
MNDHNNVSTTQALDPGRPALAKRAESGATPTSDSMRTETDAKVAAKRRPEAARDL